jgi:hypothetical protein
MGHLFPSFNTRLGTSGQSPRQLVSRFEHGSHGLLDAARSLWDPNYFR